MKQAIFRWLALALCALLLPGCALAEGAAPDIPASDYPVVDGSTATLPLSYALMSKLTGVTAEEAQQAIRHSKTTESFYALINQEAELLLVYAPSQDAFDFAKEQGVELEMKPIGRDALVFLINSENPVSSLTHEQILDIYTGQATNWSQVGGQDLDIVAYQRVENSGSQVMMQKQVMKETPMMEAPSERRPGEMNELVDVVASYQNTPSAIGYSVYFYVHNMYTQENIKLLNINGVAPENESIASGAYPYVQDFHAVIRKDAAEESNARKIYNWLDTDEARALIEEAGYVAIAPESAAQ